MLRNCWCSINFHDKKRSVKNSLQVGQRFNETLQIFFRPPVNTEKLVVLNQAIPNGQRLIFSIKSFQGLILGYMSVLPRCVSKNFTLCPSLPLSVLVGKC